MEQRGSLLVYTGYIAEIPIGHGSLDKSENYRAVPIENLISALNLEMENNVYRKEPGSAHTNGTVLGGAPAVIGGSEYWVSASTRRLIIATSDGEIYRSTDSGANFSSIKSSLGTDKKTVMCEGGKETSGADKHMFIFNGYDPVQVIDADGTSTGDLATPPADWTGNTQPLKGVIHRNRLYAILGHQLYGSDLTNHETMTGGNSVLIPVFMGESSELTNIVSFMGRLFLFKKPYGIYWLDDSNTDSQYWVPKRVTGKVGCCGVDALDSGKNEVFFLSNDGYLHVMSGVQEFGDVRDSDITTLLNLNNYLRDDINRARLDRAVVRYNEEKQTVFIALTSLGGSRNDRLIKINIRKSPTIKATVTEKDECESMWTLTNTATNVGNLQFGGNAGYCWDTDEVNRNVEGVAYEGNFQFPETDFAWIDEKLANKNKIFDACEIERVTTGNYSLLGSVYIDGDITAQTLSFSLGGSGSPLDTFLLDTDYLSGAAQKAKRLPLYGTGRTLSIKFSNSGLNQNFEVAKLRIFFRVASEDLRD